MPTAAFSSGVATTYRNGQYWPQPGTFRQIEGGLWEIDAHFGTTGEHTLQLVTATDLGNVLVQYYRKVVELNLARREKLREKIELSNLSGDHPGIEMSGLQKGLRLEASVTVFVAYKVNLIASYVEPKIISPGKTLKIIYDIECSEKVAKGIWLGASFRDKTGKLYHNTQEDTAIPLEKGKNTYSRNLTIPKDAPLGEQMLGTNVWRGIAGNPDKSKRIAGGPPIQITIVK